MTEQTTTAADTTSTATGGSDQQTHAVARPEWLPESHWDTTANSIKPEFGQHYAEVSNFHKTETERQAALAARKPEDVKIEVKLPEDFKLPEGFDIKVNDDDPRVPVIRELALKRGLDQDTINDLVAMDAQMQVAAHNAEIERIAAEDQKLGANAKARKDAVAGWLKGLKDNSKITQGEYEAVRIYAVDAASVTAFEKIIAMANGTVPAGGGADDVNKPAPQSVASRWYGGTTPQQKAS